MSYNIAYIVDFVDIGLMCVLSSDDKKIVKIVKVKKGHKERDKETNHKSVS